MSYATVYTGIVGILNSLGYSEASVIDSYSNASVQEYADTFILQCLDGEADNVNSQTLADRVYDVQTWKVLVAFEKSSQSENINMGEIHAKKDLIIAAMDDPTQWQGFVRQIKYKSWALQMLESYFVVAVTIKVTDVYTY
jgi:hypothetical protein